MADQRPLLFNEQEIRARLEGRRYRGISGPRQDASAPLTVGRNMHELMERQTDFLPIRGAAAGADSEAPVEPGTAIRILHPVSVSDVEAAESIPDGRITVDMEYKGFPVGVNLPSDPIAA